MFALSQWRRSCFVFLYVVAGLSLRCAASSCIGCLELDEITFDKLLAKFQYTLIKFDIAFPYGEKHEAYSEFAKNIAPKIDELLVGLVGIKDYGEKENSAIGKRYNIDEKKYPVILLFKNYSTSNYVQYPEDEEMPVNLNNLKKFVRDQTDLYIGLEGCLKELDIIAENFGEKNEVQQLAIMDKTRRYQDKFEAEKDKETAKLYLVIMKRIVEKGAYFLNEEQRRVENLLHGKISDNKKRELTNRLNILESFQRKRAQNEQKDEL